MGDEGCAILSEVFANTRNLRSLDLRGCNIHCDGRSQYLAYAITKLFSKTWNDVIDVPSAGAVAIAKLLEGAGIREPGTPEGSTQAHSLTALSLEWNGIGTFESGIQALCKALSSNAVLVDLDLRNNSLSPAGKPQAILSLVRVCALCLFVCVCVCSAV
jgi:hypothetical protein